MGENSDEKSSTRKEVGQPRIGDPTQRGRHVVGKARTKKGCSMNGSPLWQGSSAGSVADGSAIALG